jgi:hypothetical protein
MRKIVIFCLVSAFILVLSHQVFSAELTQISAGVGVGAYAGGFAVSGDMLYRMPVMGMEKLYMKMGAGYVDTKNLTPSQSWRKLAPIQLDGILYLSDIYYIGGGINYPIKVSDGLEPNWGGQFYIGANHRTGDGRIYADMGYSVLRIKDHPSFKGLHVIAGYRYDYAKFFMPDKKPRKRILIVEEKEIVEMAMRNAGLIPAELKPPVKLKRRPGIVPRPEPAVKRAPTGRFFHYVSVGESLSEISQKYFGTYKMVNKIAAANNIGDPNYVRAGRYLVIDPNWAK